MLRRHLELGVLLFVGVIYVAAAWCPSHYALALRSVGVVDDGVLLGVPRPIRSDDYWAITPLFQIAALSDFATQDLVSPYHENLRAFLALPIRDWSLFFKPQLWGFFVFGPAHGLSFYFYFLFAAFIAGYTCLLRMVGVGRWFAAVVATILFVSHLTQVWWTTNAAVFALAPWPLLAFLSGCSWWVRLPLIAYTTAAWLMGELYPPFIIATLFAWAVLVLAFLRDRLLPGRLLTSVTPAIGGMIGLAVTWIYFSDLISLLQRTIYPGQRLSGGGGVPRAIILAHVFPYLTTLDFEPLFPGLNACEVGALSSFLPLTFAVFADHRTVVEWIRGNAASFTIWASGLASSLAWMTLPIPPAWGKPLLWHYVPPIRMLWGFGLLLTIGLTVIASRTPWRFSERRVVIFTALVIAGWLVSKIVLVEHLFPNPGLTAYVALRRAWFDLVVLVPLGLVAIAIAWRPSLASGHTIRVVLSVPVLLTSLATFGTFNPLQSARAIFRPRTSPFLEAARALGQANPNGWTAVEGRYGAIFNGLGIPSVNHVLLKPELGFFRRLYPAMPEAEFNHAFNRFEHVGLTTEPTVYVPFPDIAYLPIFDVGTPLRVDVVAHETVGVPVAGHLDVIDVAKINPLTWRAVLHGWALFEGLSPEQSLLLAWSDRNSAVTAARAVRVPRPDVGAALRNSALNTGGFIVELTIMTQIPVGALPMDALTVSSIDERNRIRDLTR